MRYFCLFLFTILACSKCGKGSPFIESENQIEQQAHKMPLLAPPPPPPPAFPSKSITDNKLLKKAKKYTKAIVTDKDTQKAAKKAFDQSKESGASVSESIKNVVQDEKVQKNAKKAVAKKEAKDQGKKLLANAGFLGGDAKEDEKGATKNGAKRSGEYQMLINFIMSLAIFLMFFS